MYYQIQYIKEIHYNTFFPCTNTPLSKLHSFKLIPRFEMLNGNPINAFAYYKEEHVSQSLNVQQSIL